jgi:hypothetical protein
MDIIQNNLENSSQHNSSVDKEEERSSQNQSLSEDNISSSFSVTIETQMQMDKYKKQSQILKLKLGDTEEENSRLKAQVEKLTLENKDLIGDLEVEIKKSKKESSSTTKMDDIINKLEQAERELQQKTLECISNAKNVKILESKISDLRSIHSEEKEKLTEDLEEFKSKCRKLEQVESINNMYKKKLEESSDFKNRLRELEEQNETLISQLEGTLIP